MCFKGLSTCVAFINIVEYVKICVFYPFVITCKNLFAILTAKVIDEVSVPVVFIRSFPTEFFFTKFTFERFLICVNAGVSSQITFPREIMVADFASVHFILLVEAHVCVHTLFIVAYQFIADSAFIICVCLILKIFISCLKFYFFCFVVCWWYFCI